MGEDTATSPTAPTASAPKNAIADLLDLDFGSSEPVSTPVMSPPTSNNNKSGPNYSADLFDMSSDMSSGGSDVFGRMGGMGGTSGMGGLNSGFQQSQSQSQSQNQNTATSGSRDAFGDLAGLGGFGQQPSAATASQQTQQQKSTQSSTVNDLLDLF